MNFIRNFIQIIVKSSVLMVIIGAVMISFSGVYVKLAHVSPTVSGFYRMFFGGICLVLIVVLKKDKIWDGLGTFILSLLCGLFFALDLFVWHKSVLIQAQYFQRFWQIFRFSFSQLLELLFWERKRAPSYFIPSPWLLLDFFSLWALSGGYLTMNTKLAFFQAC